MGKMRMGILDGFIGKVGTVVGSFWKGKKVMRGYNEFPANPNTASQELQRAKFALLGSLGGDLLNALQIGLHACAAENASTEVGEFTRLNLSKVSGSIDHLEVAYEELMLSNGSVTAVAPGEADFDTPLEVSVAIDDGYIDTRFNTANDVVFLVVYSKTSHQAVISDGSATRSDDQVSVTVPGYWQGDFVETYVFVKSAKAGETDHCSDTIYCGSGRIA